jgi:hypothetical protein
MVSAIPAADLEWSVDSPAPQLSDLSDVTIGFLLNSATYERLIDRGPPADDAAAPAFRYVAIAYIDVNI